MQASGLIALLIEIVYRNEDLKGVNFYIDKPESGGSSDGLMTDAAQPKQRQIVINGISFYRDEDTGKKYHKLSLDVNGEDIAASAKIVDSLYKMFENDSAVTKSFKALGVSKIMALIYIGRQRGIGGLLQTL